ncbi:hypothetical protein [Lactobacillus sp. PV037]|uniref:hypothetical protein n=1 Tax=Lactobacillus sp. PV037 TaxID=2594496 RepID=UPI00223F4C68|nr:hypothetical protein [Lactobacillus sp. PV037]
MILTIILVASMWLILIPMIIDLHKRSSDGFLTQCVIASIGIIETIILLSLQFIKF